MLFKLLLCQILGVSAIPSRLLAIDGRFGLAPSDRYVFSVDQPAPQALAKSSSLTTGLSYDSDQGCNAAFYIHLDQKYGDTTTLRYESYNVVYIDFRSAWIDCMDTATDAELKRSKEVRNYGSWVMVCPRSRLRIVKAMTHKSTPSKPHWTHKGYCEPVEGLDETDAESREIPRDYFCKSCRAHGVSRLMTSPVQVEHVSMANPSVEKVVAWFDVDTSI